MRDHREAQEPRILHLLGRADAVVARRKRIRIVGVREELRTFEIDLRDGVVLRGLEQSAHAIEQLEALLATEIALAIEGRLCGRDRERLGALSATREDREIDSLAKDVSDLVPSFVELVVRLE